MLSEPFYTRVHLLPYEYQPRLSLFQSNHEPNLFSSYCSQIHYFALARNHMLASCRMAAVTAVRHPASCPGQILVRIRMAKFRMFGGGRGQEEQRGEGGGEGAGRRGWRDAREALLSSTSSIDTSS